jgi:hypothetical protein
MSDADDRPGLSDAEAKSVLCAIETLIKIGDDNYEKQIAELEETIAGLHEVLRAIATEAMRLADIERPRDLADATIVDEVLSQARKVMEYLVPPSH